MEAVYLGILDKGKIESIIDFIQNDDYYPDFSFKIKLFSFSVFVQAIVFKMETNGWPFTLGVCFLLKNGHTRLLVFL